MSGFILIFFDDSPELAGDLLPAGKQTRAATSSQAARVAPTPQVVKKSPEVSSVAPVKSISDFRPFCQRKDSCAGVGLKHCYTCQKPCDAAEVPA